MDEKTKKDKPPKSTTTLKEYREKWAKDTPMIEISLPKDQALAIFPGRDGKVDMIDAARRLYGIERDEGDIVVRIRDGKIVEGELR